MTEWGKVLCVRSNALIVQREKAVHPQGHTLTPLLQASINFYASRGSVAIRHTLQF